MQPPKRAFELTIKIGGDTWEDVIHNVRDLLPHIEEHGQSCNSVSGSPSCGHIVDIQLHPEMTHERYHEELQAYIAFRDAQKRGESLCELCGKPMPEGETMFRYHGYSDGSECPK